MSTGMGHTPITTNRVAPLIERTYREGSAFQWAREALINSAEAGATKVHFGVEWQGVVNKGVYRQLIADNGCGMDESELRTFFGTFGGGGKPIGGEHENFGVGAKTSLLPWNKAGVAVCSRKNGQDYMIYIEHDSVSGEYGLRRSLLTYDDGTTGVDDVYDPYEDEDLGVDFSALFDDPVFEGSDSGVAILLVGNSLKDNTFTQHDPKWNESGVAALAGYLNGRIWDASLLPKTTIDEFSSPTQSQWPKFKPLNTSGQGGVRSYTSRTLAGAKYFTESLSRNYPGKYVRTDPETGVKTTHQYNGKTVDGVVALDDGTQASWYLRVTHDGSAGSPDVLTPQSYAPKGGWFIAVRYKNELYEIKTNGNTWRSFGVREESVRKRCAIILDPPQFDKDKHYGIYPKSDRNSLAMGSTAGATVLPWDEWGVGFAKQLPKEIIDAIAAAQPPDQASSLEDKEAAKRLMNRFAARWFSTRLIGAPNGKSKALLDALSGKTPGKTKTKTKGGKRTQIAARQGDQPTGTEAGKDSATQKSEKLGLPDGKYVPKGNMDQPWFLAQFTPAPAAGEDYPNGVVELNEEHPVIQDQIKWHQERMVVQDDPTLKEVKKIVRAVYKDMAIATVAHVEVMKSIAPPSDVDKTWRSPEALTTALMGLIDADALIGPRLGKVGKTTKNQ